MRRQVYWQALAMNLEICTCGLVVSVNLTVGLRLLWKGRAQRTRPELLLGAAFALDALMIAFTVAAALALWLSFFPPQAYKSWLSSEVRSTAS